MPEWLYEDGIGERRAALIDGGAIVAALIECDDDGPRLGAVLPARLGPRTPGGALARLEGGGEALLPAVPERLGEGAALLVEIVREGIPEHGNPKPPRARPAPPGAAPSAGPSLLDQIRATGLPVAQPLAHGPDLLEAAGWSELLEEATHGRIAFPGGLLRMALTPAMTLFDVDGTLPPVALAIAGAAAAGAAIRRLDIGGSIGIDLPTLAGKAERQAAAAALDAALPPPFERTAVNGFGFLQVVRRRERPSLPERIAADPLGAAARALLRRAEHGGAGAATLVAGRRLTAWLEAHAACRDALARRRGGAIRLRCDPALSISGGHVEPRSS